MYCLGQFDKMSRDCLEPCQVCEWWRVLHQHTLPRCVQGAPPKGTPAPPRAPYIHTTHRNTTVYICTINEEILKSEKMKTHLTWLKLGEVITYWEGFISEKQLGRVQHKGFYANMCTIPSWLYTSSFISILIYEHKSIIIKIKVILILISHDL